MQRWGLSGWMTESDEGRPDSNPGKCSTRLKLRHLKSPCWEGDLLSYLSEFWAFSWKGRSRLAVLEPTDMPSDDLLTHVTWRGIPPENQSGSHVSFAEVAHSPHLRGWNCAAPKKQMQWRKWKIAWVMSDRRWSDLVSGLQLITAFERSPLKSNLNLLLLNYKSTSGKKNGIRWENNFVAKTIRLLNSNLYFYPQKVTNLLNVGMYLKLNTSP